MLTVNTHFPDGYLEKSCKKTIKNNQYANVIACSSKQVDEFINWVKKQDFYENTTIILVGDHVSMANNEILNIKDRMIYNTIINSSKEAKREKNRKFTFFDMFPKHW